jgi:hypothetical protein
MQRHPVLSVLFTYNQTVAGWDVYKQRVQLNGLSTVAGFPTPIDTDVPPDCPCPNDDCPLDGSWDFNALIDSSDPPPNGSNTYIEFISEGDVVQDDDDGGPNDFGFVSKPSLIVWAQDSCYLCHSIRPLSRRQ